MKLVTWLIKLYPQAWRTRYQEEMLATLDEHNITMLTIFDLIFGALDAHMDPYYRTEWGLFSLPRPRAAMGIFLTALTMFLSFVQLGQLLINQGAMVLLTGNNSEAFRYRMTTGPNQHAVVLIWVNIPVDPTSPLWTLVFLCINIGFFIVTVLIIITLIKEAIAARKVGMLLFAAFCFVLLPGALLSLFSLGSFTNSILLILIMCGPLEALMGVLFLSILRWKQALLMRKKGLLCLIIIVNLLLILIGRETIGAMGLGGENLPFLFSQLVGGVFPFAVIGMSLLFLAEREVHKRMWQFALIPAVLVALIMLATLCFFFIGSFSVWQQFGLDFRPGLLGSLFPFPTLLPDLSGQGLPVTILLGAGLTLSVALALIALRLACATPRTVAVFTSPDQANSQ